MSQRRPSRVVWPVATVLGLCGCSQAPNEPHPSGAPVGLSSRMASPQQTSPAKKGTAADLFQDDINPFDPPTPTRNLEPDEPRVLQTVGFSVLKIRLPYGTASRSQILWNHIREEQVGADKMLLLRKNGFRVGLGERESWPPIKAILDHTPGAKLSKLDNMGFVGRAPLQLYANTAEDEQTVFYYTADGVARGVTFENCGAILNVVNFIDPQFPDAVTITVVPELCQMTRRMKWDPVSRQYIEQHRRIFLRHLSVSISISDDQFLLIGPSAQIDLADSLVGRRFLVTESEGVLYENLLVLTPWVQQIVAQPG